MIPGIVAAQMRVVAGGGTLWTPLNMATVPQIYLDAQDSVVTDVSGFASAISNLGAMGANGDFSQGTAASRPEILAAELNGKRVLRFDGSNDYLLGSSVSQTDLFRAAPAAWAYFVYKKRVVDGSPATKRMFHASNNVTTGAVRFTAHASVSTGTANAPTLSGRRLDADAQFNLGGASAVVGNFVFAMFAVNYATREGEIIINGSAYVADPVLVAAAGVTSDTASGSPLSIGARYDGLVPADVDIAAVVISNTYPSTDDRQKLEGWAAHKYGLTASLPIGHPYKTVAPTA